ncbi:periplasmic nitrate reductase subunit NapB [Ferrimonas sediminum]|uniref:Periplasmic nitrate reductase, electron transfer subunit n=1 Tax=Ferrimonas sediminum TaxID=718193 RepID=A0A1G8T1U6_9GAMM|nr:nitrate reductase cytochrome c-type subunit [Ferrimonas sediminum]SDJ35582.1 periplasmic nitrate reductase subunit NapB [Ferrimonas sediminum]
MKTAIIITTLVSTLTLASATRAGDDAVTQSLRGATPVAEQGAPEAAAQYPKKGKSIERTMAHQPPLVPHKASYPINLKRNGCVSCHSPAKAKRMKTTAIDPSHYLDDGKLDNRFYNCNQCHVPQASNREPDVGNSYRN